jgi:two-component system, OmpR family, sensor kinase
MSDPVWYRSLYWRIALGFVLCLTGLLIAQALLFLWLAERNAPAMLARSPQHLAAVVASDLSDALEGDEHADLPRMLREQYADRRDRIIAIMRDGRAFQNVTDSPPPDWALRAALYRLRYDRFNDSDATAGAGDSRETRDSRDSRDGRGAGGGGGGPMSRRMPASPIQVKGATAGLVLVIPARRPPFPFLQEFGPTLAAAGLVLLVVGTAVMAFFVFQPARRRLRKLEAAAEAIGAGDTSVRAPQDGGDEVAELAKVFNRMAADLDARVRELQEVDRARRQLLADVSHELMTPLTAMRGYLETLALPIATTDPDARDRYLHIVTEETLRLEAIIGDLLDLARLEGGGAALQRDAVPVQMLFERAAERHGATLHERHITLRTQIDPGAELVEGDARRLEQAVQNLVANAARHVGEGGEIALTASPADAAGSASAANAANADTRRVRLRIDDNGPGIPAEHLPRIFDRFYRVDAARDQASGGSGLGLSIVRAIIEAHGGTVTATASPSGGARFEIILNTPRSR